MVGKYNSKITDKTTLSSESQSLIWITKICGKHFTIIFLIRLTNQVIKINSSMHDMTWEIQKS